MDLIERLKKSAGPDRELDDAIASWLSAHRIGIAYMPCPRYTHSIDAALTLVPKDMVWMVQTEYCLPGRALCHVNDVELGNFDYHDGATPAIAICVAALMAHRAALSENSPVT